MIVMKKQLIRALSLLLVCVCFISICTPAVLAASTTSSKSFTGSKYGGTSSYIYVKTKNSSSSKSVKLTFNKGTLTTTSETGLMASLAKSFDKRAAYEIKIYYWDEDRWVKENSYDVYNKSSKTVTLNKKDTYYKIQVYQWRASTTLTSYKKNDVVSYSTSNTADGSPYWSKLPTFKVSSPKKATIYTSNPLS